MASYFTLTLDTTGPQGVAVSIDAGAAYTTDQNVDVTITTTDTPTTGYQVKIWGNVDTAANANIQATEGASAWITLASPHAVVLSAGDGTKTINVRMRDDVLNESGIVSDSITLDTSIPVVTISSGPDRTKVSEQAGVNVSSFSWQADQAFQAYKVKVVPATNSLESAGTQIGTTNGSVNTSGGAGAALTNINTQINASDLKAASAGDGDKIIKVFVQDDAGNWSV